MAISHTDNRVTEGKVNSMTDTPAIVQRVAGLWYRDNAMVVLQAENKEFRLPLAILASRSPVFMAYLSSSLNASKSESIDPLGPGPFHTNGCLCIKLLDSAEDAEYFFRAIFDSGYFEPPPSRFQLNSILGILSLSNGYQVQYLKKRALAHLDTGYPTTLIEWKSRLERSTFLPVTNYSIPFASLNISKTLATVKIADRVKARWVLPAALYECCRYEMKDLIGHPDFRTGLDGQLRDKILTGYYNQTNATRQILSFLFVPPPGGCNQASVCSEIRRCCAEEVLGQWVTNNPLGIWDEEDWDLLEGVCAVCLGVSRSMHAQAREEIWRRLPELYELEPWGALLELKEAAMS